MSEVTDPQFKHEIFMRIDMKHSYVSNSSIFSVVGIIIELFVVCQKCIHSYVKIICYRYIKKFY